MDFKISKAVFSSIFFFYCTIILSECQLRVIGGKALTEANFKNYMVHLVKADESERVYDTWICGGVIVTALFILTSAACVEDVKHMYAVQGIVNYEQNWKTDECVTVTKKKIVEYCVPHAYEFNFANLGLWSKIDIALAKVEAAYAMNKEWTAGNCKVKLKPPGLIPINFYPQYQETGTDVFVLGWGHNESFRAATDQKDYNQKAVHFAAAQIIEKSKCKDEYAKSNFKDLNTIIDNYMICSDGEGLFDSDGNIIKFDSSPALDGCKAVSLRMRAECIKALGRMDKSAVVDKTRRNGICQNDHGGPLVTWVGSQEYVVGVASVFLIRGKSQKCTGPFLYASTYCNSGFLRCVLKGEQEYTEIFKNAILRRETTLDVARQNNIATDEVTVPINPIDNTTPQLPVMPPQPQEMRFEDQNEDDDEIMSILRGQKLNTVDRRKVTKKTKITHSTTSTTTESTTTESTTTKSTTAESTTADSRSPHGPMMPPPPPELRLEENNDDDDEILKYLNFLRGGPELQVYCNQPARKRGFEIVKSKISWRDHKDGPAANELVEDLLLKLTNQSDQDPLTYKKTIID